MILFATLHLKARYAVATISRLLKITGLFCRISSDFSALWQKRPIIWRGLLIGATSYETCDTTCFFVWHDLFICVIWLIHTCDMTHLSLCEWAILFCDWDMFFSPSSGLRQVSSAKCDTFFLLIRYLFLMSHVARVYGDVLVRASYTSVTSHRTITGRVMSQDNVTWLNKSYCNGMSRDWISHTAP